jgi:hypothetical protein
LHQRYRSPNQTGFVILTKVRHPGEGRDPFSAVVDCMATPSTRRGTGESAGFDASPGKECKQNQRGAEWMLTFVNMTSPTPWHRN